MSTFVTGVSSVASLCGWVGKDDFRVSIVFFLKPVIRRFMCAGVWMRDEVSSGAHRTPNNRIREISCTVDCASNARHGSDAPEQTQPLTLLSIWPPPPPLPFSPTHSLVNDFCGWPLSCPAHDEVDFIPNVRPRNCAPGWSRYVYIFGFASHPPNALDHVDVELWNAQYISGVVTIL